MKGKQPSKADLKLIRSLSRKKSREESGLFVVEGEKCVEEALESGLRIHSLYYMDEIGEEMMGRMTLLSTPSPALALLFRRKRSWRNSPRPLSTGWRWPLTESGIRGIWEL